MSKKRSNKIFIHQPDFAPWITFFKRISFSDIFVILDDVQFNRRCWMNRDYLKFNLEKALITIPTKKTNRDNTKIFDVKIDYTNKRWIDKTLNSIHQNYSSTKNFEIVNEFLSKTLKEKYENLIDLNLSIINFATSKLNIKTKTIFSSKLETNSFKSNKILEICEKLQATDYIIGSGAKEYLNIKDFQDKKIKLIDNIFFNRKYDQKGNFIKDLSIIDILFNENFKDIEIFIKDNY